LRSIWGQIQKDRQAQQMSWIYGKRKNGRRPATGRGVHHLHLIDTRDKKI
jgi:hypothetical protein